MDEGSTSTTGSTGEHPAYRAAEHAETYQPPVPSTHKPVDISDSGAESHHVDVGSQYEKNRRYVETTIDTKQQALRREISRLNEKMRGE